MNQVGGLIWNNPYLRFIILVLLLVGSFFLLRLTVSVWSAFLIAFLLAYLLEPALTFFGRKTNRLVGMLSIVAILILLLAMLWILGLYVASQLARFSLTLPLMTTMVQEAPFTLARRIDPKFGELFAQIYTNLKYLETTATTRVLPQLLSGQGSALTGLTRVAGSGGQLGVIFILTLYLLYGFPKYLKALGRLLPHRYRHVVEDFVSKFGFAVGGYVRGQILVGVISGLLTYVAMLIIGVPLAPVIGITYGIANFIPYFGPVVAAIPTVLFSFPEGGQKVAFALLALLIVNQLDGNIISPFIFSKFISLDPVSVIIALLLGGVLFGFIGLILAIPVAAFIKVLVNEYYVDSKWYKRTPSG
jgi:predicted PurR-regulated permease PerM